MKKFFILSLTISFIFAFDLSKCASCHGHNLNKFTSNYIKYKLNYFRNSDIMPMSKIVKKLSDEEIEKISKMYGKN